MASHSNFNKDNQAKKHDIFSRRRSLNKSMDNATKSEKLMNGIGLWTSYYRLFPHLFVRDYLGINLKVFQMILIYFMMHYHYFLYIASRGQGKSYLTAIFCITRCILFPETKIVIAAGNLKQAIEVIGKIQDMMGSSSNLAREIDDIKTSPNNAGVYFKNGSTIRVAASNDGARGLRANLIIVDEFRIVPLEIINKVIRKFMSAPRQPKYLQKPEYAHLKERNKEIYLSSAWYKHHWSWDKVNAYFESMTDGKSYFLCSLPYQLPIKEGLLMREQVEDEMSESDFQEIAWLMEMEALFYGESEKAFYRFADIEKNRVLNRAIYPKSFYEILKNKSKDFKYEEKQGGEIRLISCDVSGMSSAKNNNDASVFSILRLIPSSDGKTYDKYIVYMESVEGGHSQSQAIQIRRLYEEFDCDYIVLDTNGIGLGIYDALVTNLYDKERNVAYPAFSCINDTEMAKRCMEEDAPKVIYSIKASAQINNDMHVYVLDGLKRGKIRLLVDETECKETLVKYNGYEKLPVEEQVKFVQPYVQTSLLVQEMVGLEKVDTNNSLIKLKELSTKRKDRYSSIGYGVYIAKLLEKELSGESTYNEDMNFVLW
nr:MAG TPA: large terminase [Caudoviricetes sp.]